MVHDAPRMHLLMAARLCVLTLYKFITCSEGEDASRVAQAAAVNFIHFSRATWDREEKEG